MADDTLDIRETLPFEATTRPYGTFYNYDMEALSQDQQEYVNRVKLCVLREQHRYLSRHPEVGIICKLLLSECLYRKPKSVHRFAAEFCKDDYRGETLRKRVDRYLEVQERAKERARKMTTKVPKQKKSADEDIYYSSDASKTNVKLRFEEEIQKIRSFLQTFPPKELPSGIHLPHDYYEKLQRMLKDLSRVHPTYRYAKEDEYQMTYEHICEVLNVNLRQLGLDVDVEIEPCEPCHGKKKEIKEVPEKPITQPKPDRKEKRKFSKCHLCLNCIDSESPGFEDNLCAQCWFWHQAKVESTEETLEKKEPKQISIDQVPLSPCDSCASCLREEKIKEKEASEESVEKEQVGGEEEEEEEEEDLGDRVSLDDISLSLIADNKDRESVATKKMEARYFERPGPKQRVNVVELIRQWIVKWKAFLYELDLARENGLISQDSYIYLRYFKEHQSETERLDRKEDQEEGESVKKKSSSTRSSEATYRASKVESEFLESIFVEGEEEEPKMFNPYHGSSSSSEEEPLEVQSSRPADEYRCNKCKQCLEGKICLTEAQQRDRNLRILFDVLNKNKPVRRKFSPTCVQKCPPRRVPSPPSND